jgi:hypothetical protein
LAMASWAMCATTRHLDQPSNVDHSHTIAEITCEIAASLLDSCTCATTGAADSLVGDCRVHSAGHKDCLSHLYIIKYRHRELKQ